MEAWFFVLKFQEDLDYVMTYEVIRQSKAIWCFLFWNWFSLPAGMIHVIVYLKHNLYS
jgi:hypothetical protein